MSVDDDRQQLLEGQQKAREMISRDTAEKLAELRDRAVRRFFGEQGIPPHLKEGWAVLEESRRARAEAGYPLPPGGVLLLGVVSVVAGCLAEMHTALADMLHLSVDAIRMRIERDERGGLVPMADIAVPDDWLLPCAKDPAQSPEDATKEFLEKCRALASAHFRANVSERLGSVNTIRPDVAQPLESFGGEE